MNNPPVVSRVHGTYDDYTLFRVLQGTAFITGAKGLYYNRNRFYSPTLCRFTTRDPNEAALPILAAMIWNASNVELAFGAFDALALLGDGMNLYVYLGSRPVNGNDPLGLTSSAEVLATRGITVLLFGALLGSAIVADKVGHQLSLGFTGVAVDHNGAFVKGIEALIAGQYAVAEGIFESLREEFTGKTVAIIIALYKIGSIQKTPMPPGGPGWKEILRKTWEEIVDAARKGQKWAKTVKKLLTDKRFDK